MLRLTAHRPAAAATGVAAILSGVPSTVHAGLSRGDPLRAARSAASLIGVAPDRELASLAAGAVVHLAVSSLWGAVLARVLPRGRRTRWGVVAGAGIYVLDLRVIAPLTRRTAITDLPQLPQLLDHLAFAALVGFLLDRWEPAETFDRATGTGLSSRPRRGAGRRARPSSTTRPSGSRGLRPAPGAPSR